MNTHRALTWLIDTQVCAHCSVQGPTATSPEMTKGVQEWNGRDGDPAREHRCQSLVFFIKAWKKIDKMLRAIHLSGDNTVVGMFSLYLLSRAI